MNLSVFTLPTEYTALEDDEALPLSSEFQRYLSCFTDPSQDKIEKRFQPMKKAIDILR